MDKRKRFLWWDTFGGTDDGDDEMASGRLIGFRVLTVTGTYTPTAGTTAIYVKAQGGGGSAGGVSGLGGMTVTGGGSAGSVCEDYITPIAASYEFTIGAGGAAPAAGGNNGNVGGTTTFGNPAVLTAPGGPGSIGLTGDGAFSQAQCFPPGGAVSNAPTGGDINTRGAAGSPAFCNQNADPTYVAISGAGASGPYGTGGAPMTANGNGNAATGFGAGGSGARSDAGNQSGGPGSPGVILVWEYS